MELLFNSPSRHTLWPDRSLLGLSSMTVTILKCPKYSKPFKSERFSCLMCNLLGYSYLPRSQDWKANQTGKSRLSVMFIRPGPHFTVSQFEHRITGNLRCTESHSLCESIAQNPGTALEYRSECR